METKGSEKSEEEGLAPVIFSTQLVVHAILVVQDELEALSTTHARYHDFIAGVSDAQAAIDANLYLDTPSEREVEGWITRMMSYQTLLAMPSLLSSASFPPLEQPFIFSDNDGDNPQRDDHDDGSTPSLVQSPRCYGT